MRDGLIEETDIRPVGAIRVSETGLHEGSLFKLILKTLFARGVDTPKQVSESTKLHIAVVRELLETAKLRSLVEVLGSIEAEGYTDFRYSLTAQGRERASDALAQCQYVGAAPINLDEYLKQMEKQGIRKEIVGKDSFQDHLSHLVMANKLKRIIGPGINSGRSMLLYGPPGNGKTSIAVAVAKAFRDHIYIPHAIEVEGETIKYFDPVIHRPIATAQGVSKPSISENGERPEFTDRRWIPCERPTVIIGGELTMNMLDLYFSPVGKYYEMPMQIKANGGILVIDDLGRQQVSVTELLNRWIMPMEKHIDYLALQSGATFSLPFDNLLIFSTNLEPADLMDPAFLRRIPYKVHVGYPTEEEFTRAFRLVCHSRNLDLTDDNISRIVDFIRSSLESVDMPLAYYQAGFITDQIIEQSRFEGSEPEFTQDKLASALENLSPRRQ
jgi:predicted ATPase with chaperone activity